jgi:hypothetical protein
LSGDVAQNPDFQGITTALLLRAGPGLGDFMRLKIALLAAVVAAAPAEAGLFTVSPPSAADMNFHHCDGYGPPSGKADGITVGTWLFGAATTTVDERRGKTALGAAGLAACDAAMADPRLQAAFVTRRGHLLQARAIHLVALGKFDEALKSLARSDEAGRGDPYFDLSVGQGNRALRAVAMNGLGKAAEAEAAIAELDRRRPYATSQRQLAMRARLQFVDDREQQQRVLAGMAPQIPLMNHQLFWQSMMYGDFAGALRQAPAVSFDDPKDRAGWTGENDTIEKYTDVIERSNFAGALAYAQFASGAIEASSATLKQAEQRVNDSIAPPPAPMEGQKWSKRVQRDYDLRKLAGATAQKRLAMWRSNIALRAQAPTMTMDEIMTAAKAEKVKLPMIGDIFAHAKVPELKDSAALNAMLKDMAAIKDEERLKATRMSFQDLVALLPRPEIAGTQIRFKSEGGLLGNGLEGYAVKKGRPAGATTVRYGTAKGTLAMADEGVMLAAAQYARSEGKDAFVIDAREPIQRTIRYVGYMAGRTENSGYEVRLVVRPVASATASESARARLIKVADVVAALEAKLVPPAASGAGQ